MRLRKKQPSIASTERGHTHIMSAANNERKRKTDEEEEEKRKARRLAFEQCVKEAEGMSEAMSENVRQLLKRTYASKCR